MKPYTYISSLFFCLPLCVVLELLSRLKRKIAVGAVPPTARTVTLRYIFYYSYYYYYYNAVSSDSIVCIHT